MRSVKENISMNNGMIVLICEMFGDEIVTGKLSTNAGTFGKEDFIVEKAKSCFGKPTTRNILLRNQKPKETIKEFEFV